MVQFLHRVRIARKLDHFCPSVCPSVTFQYCVQTNEDTIAWFLASDRTIIPVSGR